MEESGGRQRRSAAAASNKAWAALIPNKHKGDDDENDETSTKKKAKTEVQDEDYRPPASPPPMPATISASKFVVKTSSVGFAAMGKEQIENIQREMDRTYMSNDEDDPDFDNDEDRFDDDDEEFDEKPRASRSSRGRGRPPTNSRKDRPVQSAKYVQSFASRPLTGRVVVPQTVHAGRYIQPSVITVNEKRPVFILRPSAKTGVNGPTVSSMSVSAAKEIEDISKKCADRLVAGDSVQKFNDLVGVLLEELKTMADDRARAARNNQEMIEQMGLSHAAAIDIKDSRIRQLEECVSSLQSKIALLTSKLQASLLEHETVKGSVSATKPSPKKEAIKVPQRYDDESPDALNKMDESNESV